MAESMLGDNKKINQNRINAENENKYLIMSEFDRPYREDEPHPPRTREDDLFCEYIRAKYNLRLADEPENDSKN